MGLNQNNAILISQLIVVPNQGKASHMCDLMFKNTTTHWTIKYSKILRGLMNDNNEDADEKESFVL